MASLIGVATSKGTSLYFSRAQSSAKARHSGLREGPDSTIGRCLLRKQREWKHNLPALNNLKFRQTFCSCTRRPIDRRQLLSQQLCVISSNEATVSVEKEVASREDDGYSQSEEVIGVIVVDHGSRRAESNQLLDAFVSMYQAQSGRSIVEAAHMEIARPSISEAFDRVVERGANTVIVSPYFLSPGRHWFQDIPDLVAEASEKHKGIKYLVTAPIGLHPLMADIIEDRIDLCLKRAAGKVEECEVCKGTGRCKMVDTG